MYDYIIVGAGLFGAVFAHEAYKNGKRCLVIDRRNHIAGNAFTENIEGINVHKYGAHIFHTSNKDIWKYVNQFADFNNYINSPVAIYDDELYNLPFNMNTFSKMWNVKTPNEAKAILKEQINREKSVRNNKNPSNLEEQALSLVGRDIYEKLIKGYTEKQWGRECKALPASIIKRLPVRFTYDNNYFNDVYQGIPIGGYTSMVQKMLEGVEVRLATDLSDIYDVTKREFKEMSADKIVYTGPIDEFYEFSMGHLQYRTLKFETEVLECDNYQGDAVVNYTKREVPYTRIIEHKHFEKSSVTNGKTVISREYPCEWKEGNEQFYPIVDDDNNKLANQYREKAAQEKHIIFGGRLGEYRYYDMDKVIEKALLCAEQEFSL